MMAKHILITGSTDGIGKLAALQLGQEGHIIYLHGRKQEKLSRVIAEIKQQSNNENIKGFVADFSDLAAVQLLAQQVKAEVPQLDVLINNAGVFKSPVATNKDGLDLRFVVNYFAPYLLTKALISTLEKGIKPRIINLSSAAQAPISYAALHGKTQLSTQETYAQSKLAITMWSFSLAKELQNIQVIAVNPGSLLNTNMVREGFGYHRSSADKGADILYDLAISPNYEGVTGEYFDNDRGAFGRAHGEAYREAALEKLASETKLIIKE